MPLPANTSLLKPLIGIRRSLLRRAIGKNCANALGAAAGLFVLLELWQLGFKLTESAAALTASVGLLLIAVVFLFCHVRLLLRQPSPTQLALVIENARPELLDAFVCAVELEQKRASGAPLRHMEESLLADIQDQYADDNAFFAAIFRSHLSWRRPLLHAIAAITLAVIAVRSDALAKATYGLHDLLAGQNTGITVEMPATEMPAGSDARVLATVHRWEKQAEIIYADGNDEVRLPMPATQDGRFAFTFYSLADSVRFRIVTPALTSRWHELPVFTPPAIDAVTMTVTPQAYTGRPIQVVDVFTDLGLIAGETLTVAIEAPLATEAWLLSDDNDAQAFQPASNDRLELTCKPKQTGQRRVRLQDAAGHRVDSQPFTITVSPDLPPIIELRAPEQDTQLKPGDAVRLSLFAGDDFGINEVTLQYSINGGQRQSIKLWENNGKERQQEVEYSEIWDIPGLKLEEGDLISAQVIAADNREPEPQRARSELFFIVIRPEQETAESDGASGPQKKMDISDLLAESKRLLRLTWDVLTLADAPRARAASDLVRGVRELELEVRRRFNTIQEESQGMVAEPLPTLFTTCSHELNQAVALLERNLTEESISPQERALAALVKIETELLRNAMKSKKSQEGSEDSEGEQQEQQQQSDPSSQAEQAQQRLEKMREMLENLRRLTQRQESVNENVNQPGAILSALAAKQDDIGADAADIRDELTAVPEAASAAASVRNAEQEMSRASSAMQAEDARTGGIHGARARLQLLAALRQLEDAIRKASANAIAQLAEQAAQLSEAQKQAANQSEQAAQGAQVDHSAAREQQQKLSQMTEKLQERLRQTADGIQKDFPDAAQALREAGRQAQARGLPESQQRAQNALLYKRFDRAAKEQTDAANYLQALANDLHEAGGKLPPMSEEELRDALQRLQELASQTEAAARDQNQERARQRLDQIRSEAAQTLQPFAEAFKDQRLQQITDDMSMPSGEESPSEAADLMFQQFRAAATVLEQLLGKMTVERKVKLHRDVVTPPEKYQRQVEEYFKGLGQD
ncbi:MAG: hypothetical protein BWX73_00205 [Lentisphaerae bacterium ADurb.Bin082]|nr:MAG: hypothetical protein BWX73_00205 [Lentisphaerae bacterium ADurb.Bin082]